MNTINKIMTLHTKLNEISNDEFDSISSYTPVEKFLDISFETLAKEVSTLFSKPLISCTSEAKEVSTLFSHIIIS